MSVKLTKVGFVVERSVSRLKFIVRVISIVRFCHAPIELIILRVVGNVHTIEYKEKDLDESSREIVQRPVINVGMSVEILKALTCSQRCPIGGEGLAVRNFCSLRGRGDFLFSWSSIRLEENTFSERWGIGGDCGERECRDVLCVRNPLDLNVIGMTVLLVPEKHATPSIQG